MDFKLHGGHMGIELKSYEEAKEYFTRAMNTCEINEVILYHNQRDNARKLMKEAAEFGKRTYIEKDLSTIHPMELGGIKTENKVPDWMKPAMEAQEGKGGAHIPPRVPRRVRQDKKRRIKHPHKKRSAVLQAAAAYAAGHRRAGPG